MEIKWLGHSCFLLTYSNGIRVLTDPPSPDTGYDIPPVEADIVTSSHDHYDHSYFALASGDPLRFTEAGEYEAMGIKILGVPTFHDDCGGKKRGGNVMFLFEMDGIRLLHAGDLGCVPEADVLDKVGEVDVLMVPIGGVYTLDHRAAGEFSKLLRAKVIIPMHYRTQDVSIDIEGLEPFLADVRGVRLHRLRSSELTLTKESLGKKRVIVMEYK